MGEDGLLVDFTTQENGDSQIKVGPSEHKLPEQSKKYRAFRGCSVGFKVLQVFLLSFIFLKGDGTYTIFTFILHLTLIVTDGYMTVGYINGQAALDSYDKMIKLGINKAAEVKMSKKGKPQIVMAPDDDEEEDLRG